MPYLVNGEQVDESEIRKEAALLRPEFERAMADLDRVEAERQLWEWSRENVIEKTLLRQEALRAGDEVAEEDVVRAIEALRAQYPAGAAGTSEADSASLKRDVEIQIRVERLLWRVAENAAPPDKKAVTEFYRKHRDEFLAPETIEAAHIVKHVNESAEEEPARRVIEDAAHRLADGEDFAAVADALSDCPGDGGHLGTFARGYMVDEFDDAVFALNAGEISPVFRTTFGFHIARLIARHPRRVQPLAEIRSQIEHALHEEARHQEMERFLDNLKARAEIRKVPFDES